MWAFQWIKKLSRRIGLLAPLSTSNPWLLSLEEKKDNEFFEVQRDVAFCGWRDAPRSSYSVRGPRLRESTPLCDPSPDSPIDAMDLSSDGNSAVIHFPFSFFYYHHKRTHPEQSNKRRDIGACMGRKQKRFKEIELDKKGRWNRSLLRRFCIRLQKGKGSWICFRQLINCNDFFNAEAAAH